MADDLSRTFLGSGPAGYGVSTVMGAILTAWDPATYANTVTDGAYKYQDCLVLHPSLLVAGRVLLYMTPGGPVILGNTYQKVGASTTDPDTPGGGGGTTNPGGGTTDPGGGGTTDPGGGTGGGSTDPDPGTLPWARTYPDGTAYPTIDGGGTDTPQNLTTLASAASGGVYTYTGSTIASATSVDFTGKTDITIRGITMGQGGMLRPKAGTNIVLEVSAPYELSAGGEIVKWVGQYNRVRIDNSLFGPASAAGTPTATKNRFVQFGDSTSVGAKFGTVTRSTFRNKNGPGNPIHAAGDTANATGGVRYTLVTGCLFDAVKPFDENDHESSLLGISSLQLTDGQQVVEWNRYQDCRSEPEVISMKMNRSAIRGNTFHNCVGSASLRHGDDGEVNDNWFFGFQEEAGAGSYNRTSAGPRLYGARHHIHHNTIQVNGNGGSRPSATSLYESPLTLDSGDVAPGSTSNGHANIVDVLVEKNLLVKCGNPIMVTDNYGTAPTGTVKDNWVVECANAGSTGVRTYGSSPSTAGLTITGNTVYATVAAAGLAAEQGGHFAAPDAADRGARVVYLTAAMVGQGSTFDPWGSGAPAGGGVTAGGGTPGTWLSGVSVDAVTTIGAWRGRPVEIVSTWADVDVSNQTNLWSINPGTSNPYVSWTAPIDLAVGAIYSGESWAAAAGGAYDARWIQSLQNLHTFRGTRTTYLRFAHEMNGNWFPWSVNSSTSAAFKTAWQRFRALQLVHAPNAKLVFCPNVESSSVGWPSMWPGDSYVDVLGVDMYNQFQAQVNSPVDWTAQLNLSATVGGVSEPRGLGAYRQFALDHGKPISIPEWGGNSESEASGGDNAAFITGLLTYVAANAGTGPGQFLYEVYFNAVNEQGGKFGLYPTSHMSSGPAEYRAFF